jgi:hypothetical protein
MPFMNLGEWPESLMTWRVANKITGKQIAHLRCEIQIPDYSTFLRRNVYSSHFDISLKISFSGTETSSVQLTLFECRILNCHHVLYDLFYRDVTNPFRSYVGPRPTLWFFCSRRFSSSLTLSNPIFLPHAYSPALIDFGRERGWWITCNYPTVLKEKNRNRRSTTCAICWLKSVLHEETRREPDNHNVGRRVTLWFSC